MSRCYSLEEALRMPKTTEAERRRRMIALESESEGERASPPLRKEKVGNSKSLSASASAKRIAKHLLSMRKRMGKRKADASPPEDKKEAEDEEVSTTPRDNFESPSESRTILLGLSRDKGKGKAVATPSKGKGDADYQPSEEDESSEENVGNQYDEHGETIDSTYSFPKTMEEWKRMGYTEREARIVLEEYGMYQQDAPEEDERQDSGSAYNELMEKGFIPTCYPHRETMDHLQITRDVDLLFQACGVSKFMAMVSNSYASETAQFLDTIYLQRWKNNEHLLEKYGGGYISFTINGARYKRTLRQIQELFGFPEGNVRCPDINSDELNEIWNWIGGKGAFSSSKSKGNEIRNPCINYVRRAIAEVFFPRDKTGPINLGEMQILVIGLKKVLGRLPSGRKIRGDKANAGLAFILAKQLVGYRAKALAQRTPKPLGIGGVVCAIMEDCGVPLSENGRLEPQFMDVKYLRLQRILDSRECEDKLVYKFAHPEKANARITLPCPEFTSLRKTENASFIPPLHALITEGMKAVHKQRYSVPQGSTPPPSASQAPRVEIELPPAQATTRQTPSEGLDKYDPEEHFFEEYNEPKLSTHVKEAHKRISVLEKANRWLVKKWKGWGAEKAELTRKIEELSARIDGASPRASPTFERRHSVSVETHRIEQHEEPLAPARHSTAEVGTSKKRSRRRLRPRNFALEEYVETLGENVQKDNPYALVDEEPIEIDEDATENDQRASDNARPSYSVPSYTLESMQASTSHIFDYFQ